MANETLGTVTCIECGGEADTMQTKRGKGRLLYTNGCECGCLQPTGKTAQRRLWNTTKWRFYTEDGFPADANGVAIPLPHGVEEGQKPKGSPVAVQQPKEPSISAGYSESAQQPKPEPIATQEPKNEPSGGLFFAGLIGLAVAGVGYVVTRA